MPQSLVEREIAHLGLTSLQIVHSMHERKQLMADLSDAFLALPGGLGTLEEFCEVLTWSQLGVHGKPCGLLNVAGFYAPLLALLDHAVAERFLKPRNRALAIADDNAARLLDRMAAFRPPAVDKWIGKDEV